MKAKIAQFVEQHRNKQWDSLEEGDRKELSQLIASVNKLRRSLTRNQRNYVAKSPPIDQLKKASREIANEVKNSLFPFIKKVYTSDVSDHIQKSEGLDADLLTKDRTIFDLPEKLICPNSLDDDASGLVSSYFKSGTIFPKLSYTQMPGLHQGTAMNYLCGYYALFFLLQQVKAARDPSLKIEDLAQDRQAFNICFKEWREMIWTSRSQRLNYENQEFSDTLSIDVTSLSRYELFALINKSPFLEPVKNCSQAFYLDLEEFWQLNNSVGEREIMVEDEQLILKPFMDDEPFQVPCFLLVKKTDHYVVASLKEEKKEGEPPLWKLKVVHSLNYSIYSKEFGLNMLYNLPLIPFTKTQSKPFSSVNFVGVEVSKKN